MQQRKSISRVTKALMTAVCLFQCNTAWAQSIINPIVDITVDTTASPGMNYRNFNRAGAGVGTIGVVGLNVDVAAVNGKSIDLDPIAGFCIEIAETLSTGDYLYESGQLYQASAGLAGTIGTASSSIPKGGIGDLRAARVRYLFDHFYQSSNIARWTHTDTTSNIHAFQLALWEVSHDDDLSLSKTSGSIYFARPETNAFRLNVINLAGSWLSEIQKADVSESYESKIYEVATLTSVKGSIDDKSFQDLVIAYAKDGPEYKQFSALLPVPEPSSILSLVLGSLLTLRRRR